MTSLGFRVLVEAVTTMPLGADDAGFLAGDFGQGVSQKFLMIEGDVG